MATAETSRPTGLRSQGTPVPIVAILLVAGAIGLLVGCLRSTIFAELTVQGLALGSVYGSLALAPVLVYRAARNTSLMISCASPCGLSNANKPLST